MWLRDINRSSPSIREACRDLRDDWRQARTRIENQSRHQHAWAAIEALTFTAYSTLSLSMTLQSKLVQLAWLVAFDGKCHVSNWLVDREKMRSDRQFERLLLESKMHDPPRCDAPMPSTQAGSAFFAHLPAEIRRRILTLAFGEQTVHMHLDYRRPHQPRPKSTKNRLMPSKKKWRWRGFFCRGTWSLRNAHITAQGFTQVQDYLFIQQSWPKQCDPEYDFCLEGLETYDSAEYEASRIGIMGWLLSCRQAYNEGHDILYRTNTFRIASPALLCHMQDTMSPNIIDSLRSLEIVCNNLTTPFGKIFDFRERYLQGSDEDGRLASPPAPLFPSLSSLRISFQRLGSPWILDTGVGLPLPVENHLDLLNRLERGLYPTIDKFLDMTVPPTADVTVSSFSYDWYRVLDRKLVEKQGVSITTPQVADIGGIKCWRARTDDYLSEDESSTGSQRKGYWIHLPSPDCLSISENDEIRRKLYSGPGLQGTPIQHIPAFLRGEVVNEAQVLPIPDIS